MRGTVLKLISRSLSVLVLALALRAAWVSQAGLWYAALITGSAMVLIWFPSFVDDMALGTWHHGYKIDTRTPSVLIVAMGWVLLLLYTMTFVDPSFLSRLFLGDS